MATKIDPTREAVKRLIKADLAVRTASAVLADANEELSQAREQVSSLLPNGGHRFGKWVVNIYDKVHKGRRAPSWKSIAEHLEASILKIQGKMLGEYSPMYHPPILAFAQQAQVAYSEGQNLHTKEPTDSIEHVVELTQALDQKGATNAQA
jgi:hypothetical protein